MISDERWRLRNYCLPDSDWALLRIEEFEAINEKFLVRLFTRAEIVGESETKRTSYNCPAFNKDRRLYSKK